MRFGQGILSAKFLDDAQRALLFTPMTTNVGESTGYGLGWEIATFDGTRLVAHSGSHIGAKADIMILPELEFVAAGLSNSNNRGLTTLMNRIARLYL